MKPYLARDYVYPWIVEQEQLPWLLEKRRPKFILMDSFSELTDQKFTHRKDGWSFACHFADLIDSEQWKDEFECAGLLSLESIEAVYSKFFTWLNGQLGCPRVYFIQFPTSLDNREKFKERSFAINSTILELSKKFTNVRSVKVSDDLVKGAPDDDFPYHFDLDTVTRFTSAIREYF